MNDGSVIEGACLCGGVTFQVDAPTRFCVHCHCTMCQRAHGAPIVTWSGVPNERFRITSGEELLTRYQSSKEARRTFCSRCGSTLLFESERWAGEVHIATANLDRPDPAPTAHVFFSDRVEWFSFEDELPRRGAATDTTDD